MRSDVPAGRRNRSWASSHENDGGPPPRERKNAGAAQLARPQGKLRHDFPPRPAERRAAGGRRYCTDTLRLVRQRD